MINWAAALIIGGGIMDLPVTLWMWLLALSPVFILLILMLRFNWGAADAAPIGVVTASVVAFIFYGADFNLLALESAKGIWNAIIVLFVIWPAILLYEVTYAAGAFEVFKRGMQKFTPNELLQIMTLGWVFTSFLQGITGFGVPVAVAAPLLAGIGVFPVWAVVLALLGQAWANTFGTLGIAWQALVLSTGIGDTAYFIPTALWASGFLLIIDVFTGIAFCYFYGKMAAIRKGMPAILLISLIQGGGQMIFSIFDPNVSCFISTLMALAAIYFIGKLPFYNTPWRLEDSLIMDRSAKHGHEEVESQMKMAEAFVPYLVLTLATMIFLMIPPVTQFLNSWQLGFSFPETQTVYGVINKGYIKYSPFSPLTHAGTLLLISSTLGYLYFRSKNYIQPGKIIGILRKSVEKTVPSTIAVVALIIMSKIMGGTGQTTVLASGTAMVLGKYYAALSPGVGMLGAFMTSSNMSSNILFGEFQQMTAKLLNLDMSLILGAQTAGGAIGSTIAPSKIILGTTTVGVLGQEGLVLKKIIVWAILSATFVGAFVMIMTILNGG
ncbi:L-lactate permease [Acidaminobacter sp.]|uniref:L-lactate permease n=2 Tax=Acidaminobacter sp. TaxID=1872102 RepID=UPI0025BA4C94|nr:L-lactate permease [Acidaminobacter sp.]